MKILIAVLLLSSTSAMAYLPPSFHLARNLAKKHATIDSGVFKHKLTFYRRNGDVDRTVTETVVISGTTATIYWSDENGAQIYKFTRKLVGLRDDAIHPFTYALLYMKDANAVFDDFKAAGLPMRSEKELYGEKKEAPTTPLEEGEMPEIPQAVYVPEKEVALARFENKPMIVLGYNTANTPPQIWFEKESLMPMRTVLNDVEFRTNGYQLFKNTLYPRNLQVLRGGVLWAKAEALEVKIGTADVVFKNRNEADGDLKDLAEQYFKIVR